MLTFAFKGNSGVRAGNLTRQFHGDWTLILYAYGVAPPLSRCVSLSGFIMVLVDFLLFFKQLLYAQLQLSLFAATCCEGVNRAYERPHQLKYAFRQRNRLIEGEQLLLPVGRVFGNSNRAGSHFLSLER